VVARLVASAARAVLWGIGIETTSRPRLPISSPRVMCLRRSCLIFPRMIASNRFLSRSIRLIDEKPASESLLTLPAL
jgi:hypothetical protein